MGLRSFIHRLTAPRITSGFIESPVKLVLVINNDLKMGKGKIAAQAGHASVSATMKAGEKSPSILDSWLKSGQKKVCLKTNFDDLISVRIAIGSGSAFLVAQLLDVQVFDKLRKKRWFIAPLTSSLVGSTVDTFLFFSISFYATGIPWVTLSLGDLAVKIFVALVMLIPFRLLLGTLKPVQS